MYLIYIGAIFLLAVGLLLMVYLKFPKMSRFDVILIFLLLEMVYSILPYIFWVIVVNVLPIILLYEDESINMKVKLQDIMHNFFVSNDD